MKIKAENVELRNKIMAGINMAVRELVISSAERNEKLVIADAEGNVLHVPAKDLLKQYTLDK
jgi:hypothetical protein